MATSRQCRNDVPTRVAFMVPFPFSFFFFFRFLFFLFIYLSSRPNTPLYFSLLFYVLYSNPRLLSLSMCAVGLSFFYDRGVGLLFYFSCILHFCGLHEYLSMGLLLYFILLVW
jgi:hypothetical protein